VKNPDGAIDSVIKRNDVAKRDVELERLKMTLDMNVTTPWVKANGIGGIDQARWNAALDQIGLTFQFKDKAKSGAAFVDTFLPAAAERKLD
jgi:NitT/TauT family transport system substrate-binding protein